MIGIKIQQEKPGPLDTQVLDQGKGLIAEREGRIKLHTISNPAISIDHQISSNQRSTTMVDPPKNQIKS
jgi:hypothetical protein